MSKLLPPLISSRKKRHLHPFSYLFLALLLAGGIFYLWVRAFSPLLITPAEFIERQKRFDTALAKVLSQHHGHLTPLAPWPEPLSDDQITLLHCGEAFAIRPTLYRSQTLRIPYPWGDVPAHFGTSADLLNRCARQLGLDLQQFVHHDRSQAPKDYPTSLFYRKTPDTSLDHRRVSFLYAFAKKFFIPIAKDDPLREDYLHFQPGDLVFWATEGKGGYPGLLGWVSDRRDASGLPYVITSYSRDKRASSFHQVNDWPIAGHFRLEVKSFLQAFLRTYPTFELLAPEESP